MSSSRAWGRIGLVACAAAAGCGPPDVPAHPTWAEVEPILRAECTSCHGASAPQTGSGNRLDFYDMTVEVCQEAAQALPPNVQLARALSVPIWTAITTTTDRPTTRPRMPPEPASYLADWQWKTIRRWIDDGAPKGEIPRTNIPARIQLFGELTTADQFLDVTAVVDDPDGDPVAGVIMLGDFVLRMDRSGAFSARVDTSAWAEGTRTVSTVLCDGWSSVHYVLGTLQVSHSP